LFFCLWIIQFSQHHLLKKLSFPHCMLLAIFSKIGLQVWEFVSRLSILFHWSVLCHYHTVLVTIQRREKNQLYLYKILLELDLSKIHQKIIQEKLLSLKILFLLYKTRPNTNIKTFKTFINPTSQSPNSTIHSPFIVGS
jgi:hypothetical protein